MAGSSSVDRLIDPYAAMNKQARSLIYACDTPLLHAYLLQRAGERMMEAAGLDPRGTPRASRKTILLVARKGALNNHERR